MSLTGDGERGARFYINPVADGGDDEEAVVVNAIDITQQLLL